MSERKSKIYEQLEKLYAVGEILDEFAKRESGFSDTLTLCSSVIDEVTDTIDRELIKKTETEA